MLLVGPMNNSASISIIRSKLYRPRGAPDLIKRHRLMEAWPIGSTVGATLVSAPAGYGKSTYVAQSVSASGQRCAWLSLDPADSDLRRFLWYVVAAVRTQFPDSCREIGGCLEMPDLYAPEQLAQILSADIEALDESLVLVLDDYHAISTADVHDFTSELLVRPPSNLHLVIVTRRDPPLPLQTLRANGRLMEIRAQQLAFNDSEAKEFLRIRVGSRLTEPAALRLNQLTEGWAAGLRLASLAVESGSSTDGLLEQLPADGVDVREYLMSEVLARSSESMRRYLLCTAFLDRFCAGLCEAAVAGVDGTRAEGVDVMSGAEFVERIRDSGFFAIALDNRSEWFRYHHLFQSMLQYQAKLELGTDHISLVHHLAGAWFESNELFDEAIGHLLAADDAEAAAELMVRHRNTIMNREQWHQLDRWLRRLPPELAEAMPALLLLKARVLRTAGSREEVRRTLEAAEALLGRRRVPKDIERELRGSLESVRCYELYMHSEGAKALASARRALELLPLENHAERGFSYIILSSAMQMVGRFQEGRKELLTALSGRPGVGEVPPPLRGRLLAALCFMYWRQADLATLDTVSREAAELGSAANLGEAMTTARSFQAAVLYHRNAMDAIDPMLDDILSRKAIANLEFYAQALVISAIAKQERGDSAAASEVVRSLNELSMKSQSTFLVSLAEAFAAEIAARQGRVAEAMRWADSFRPEPFTPGYSFYWPALTLPRVLILEGSPGSRRRAAAFLDRYVDYSREIHHPLSLIHALAFRALLASESDEPAAIRDLEEALSLAQPARFIRLFVDLGPRLARLLNRLDLNDDGLAYVGEILAAFRSSQDEPEALQALGGRSSASVGVESLSRRELQVLALIARRLSNKEIASTLHISEVTVKRHTANIYQKLGVHGRRQAVVKAEGLGIIQTSVPSA